LRAGEKITAQYPLFRTDRIIGTKEIWYKIITRDDTIGWVQEDQFDFTLRPLILASDASDRRAWATYGANRGHTRAIAGTPIKNPQLRNFFTDIKANEPIYYDINADGILDVITTGIIDRLQEYERGRIAAFDGATQETLWTLASDENFDNAAPSIDKETLYCCSRGGVVYAAEVSDGTIRWTCPVGQVVLTSPVVYDTCVFVASVNGYVYAIHRDKGILLWKLQVGHTIYSTPVIKDHKLYCGLYGRNAYFVCVDLNSQKILWKYETDWMQISSSPAIVDDILLCGANDHHLYALDIANGSLKWRYKTHNPITSSPAATDSIVCVTSSDCYVYGIEIDTGKLLWKFKADEQFRASPCIIGDVLYAGSYDGSLYALSVPNGQLLWKYEIGAPIENAISGVGTLISVSTSTNNLYFIGEK
jgi:outer membrane protein assembly factor BamB